MNRGEIAEPKFTTDVVGGLLNTVPPGIIALFTTLTAVFVALGALAYFGHVRLFAQGRGIVTMSEPLIVVRAPMTGTVRTVEESVGAWGQADAVLLRLDARAAVADHLECARQLAVATGQLDELEGRLKEWKSRRGSARDSGLALVLVAQIGAQTESVARTTRRCDDLEQSVIRSNVTFPAEGVVEGIEVSAGAQVREGDVLATLAPSRAHLVAYLAMPDQYGMDLAVGRQVRLKFDAMPFDRIGAGQAVVTRVLDILPSFVKIDAPRGSGIYALLSIQAMPRGAPARPGMTFTGDVFTREGRVSDLLFRRSAEMSP